MSLPSYVHGSSDKPLLGETIGANLRRTVETHENNDALIVCSQGFRATYREFWDLTTQLAKALMNLGISRGDRVGIWAPNRYEWVVIQYATARIGAILVNINPAFKTRELEFTVNQSKIQLLLHAGTFRETDYTEIIKRILPSCSALHTTINLDSHWKDLLTQVSQTTDAELSHREETLDFDDPINIQYTSGTTGSPKGATLSHHNILNNGYFCGEILGYTHADRVVIPVPFYHCFGMVIGNLACTSHGSCIVVPSEAFDAGTTLSAIEAEKGTSIYGVPTMFIAQLSHPQFSHTDFSSLRTGVMAGSPCPIEVMKKVRDLMHIKELTICYGMTETSPVSTQTKVDAPLTKRVETVGQTHPHVEVKIINPTTGRILPRDSTGELCTRGYSVMLRYWNEPKATSDSIDESGWMHSGDLASMDASGYVKIVGRIKDMIIRGGENVYPREIEEFLYTHPDIDDAQVIGVPSEKYGEEIMAWVKPKPGSTLSEDQLRSFCRIAIAHYKIPRYWRFVDDFPMTVTGKVQKFRMREISISDLGL